MSKAEEIIDKASSVRRVFTEEVVFYMNYKVFPMIDYYWDNYFYIPARKLANKFAEPMFDLFDNKIVPLVKSFYNKFFSLFDKVKSALRSQFDKLKSLMRRVYDITTSLFSIYYDAIIETAKDTLWDIEAFVYRTLGLCKEKITPVYTSVQEKVKLVVTSVYDLVKKVSTAVYEMARDIAYKVTKPIFEVGNVVKEKVNAIVECVSNVA